MAHAAGWPAVAVAAFMSRAHSLALSARGGSSGAGESDAGGCDTSAASPSPAAHVPPLPLPPRQLAAGQWVLRLALGGLATSDGGAGTPAVQLLQPPGGGGAAGSGDVASAAVLAARGSLREVRVLATAATLLANDRYAPAPPSTSTGNPDGSLGGGDDALGTHCRCTWRLPLRPTHDPTASPPAPPTGVVAAATPLLTGDVVRDLLRAPPTLTTFGSSSGVSHGGHGSSDTAAGPPSAQRLCDTVARRAWALPPSAPRLCGDWLVLPVESPARTRVSLCVVGATAATTGLHSSSIAAHATTTSNSSTTATSHSNTVDATAAHAASVWGDGDGDHVGRTARAQGSTDPPAGGEGEVVVALGTAELTGALLASTAAAATRWQVTVCCAPGVGAQPLPLPLAGQLVLPLVWCAVPQARALVAGAAHDDDHSAGGAAFSTSISTIGYLTLRYQFVRGYDAAAAAARGPTTGARDVATAGADCGTLSAPAPGGGDNGAPPPVQPAIGPPLAPTPALHPSMSPPAARASGQTSELPPWMSRPSTRASGNPSELPPSYAFWRDAAARTVLIGHRGSGADNSRLVAVDAGEEDGVDDEVEDAGGARHGRGRAAPRPAGGSGSGTSHGTPGLPRQAGRVARRVHVGENTLQSLCAAADAGAEFVEFDVQLTRDGHPVLHHDWGVRLPGMSGGRVPVGHLTAREFLAVPPSVMVNDAATCEYARARAADAIVAGAGVAADAAAGATVGATLGAGVAVAPRVPTVGGATPAAARVAAGSRPPFHRRSRSADAAASEGSARPSQHHPHHVQRRAPQPTPPHDDGGEYGLAGRFTTLAQALARVPLACGFNLELKYPTPAEAQLLGLAVPERNAYVEAVLDVVYAAAAAADATTAMGGGGGGGGCPPLPRRRLLFSSFDPDVCALVASKAGSEYPVCLLTEGGCAGPGPGVASDLAGGGGDWRCGSLAGAAAFAAAEGLLGVVCDAAPLLAAPALVTAVRHGLGLALASYGRANNAPGSVRRQAARGGLSAAVVDHVRHVARALEGE